MWRKRKEEKKVPVPGRVFEPTTLTLEGKAPVCIATFTLHKDPWLQLLYKYHERYILRESVIELNLKVQKLLI